MYRVTFEKLKESIWGNDFLIFLFAVFALILLVLSFGGAFF